MKRNSIAMLGVCGALAAALAIPAAIVTVAESPAQSRRRVPIVIADDAAMRPWVRYAGWPTRDFSRFNTLASTVSPPPSQEPRRPSGPIPGDPAIGQKLAGDRSRGGSCLACHVMGPAGNADLPGNVGPDLSELGNAGREDEWLFNYVYDPRVYNRETLMPPWGAHDIFNDAEIGHIVAFLKTLKQPVKFATALDDPSRRPVPVEKRDNLDPLVNPGMWAIERAEALWRAPGPSGSSCSTCHENPDAAFKSWAAGMPKWEPRLDKVLGIEELVTRHAKVTTGHSWSMQSDESTAIATRLRYLANGVPINVDVADGPANEAYERGRALTLRKQGQLNFACVDCHSPTKGGLKWIRGQWLGELRGQLDHFPTWRTSQQSIWDARKRFQWCAVAIGANELPPDAKEYGDLELYLTAQSAGLKLSAPGIRH